ncbi:MAG: hypothetical protein SV487_07210 [Thermodesulfobacteriota bacterium]|nr:hypothetical protein [Thermodesulfobacteriota bacterium]
MSFLRWVMIVVLFYLIYRVVKGLGRPSRPMTPPQRDNEVGAPGASRSEDLVQDPQCGVFIPRSEGVASVVDGQVLYFCSTGCRDKFLEARRRNS